MTTAFARTPIDIQLVDDRKSDLRLAVEVWKSTDAPRPDLAVRNA